MMEKWIEIWVIAKPIKNAEGNKDRRGLSSPITDCRCVACYAAMLAAIPSVKP